MFPIPTARCYGVRPAGLAKRLLRPGVTHARRRENLSRRWRAVLARWPAGPLLALVASVVTMLVLEVALRLRGHLENLNLLSSTVGSSPDPLPGTRVTLGQMIRLSSNRRIVYELRPNLDVVFQGARVTTNHAGFRGLLPQRASDAFRIVGIGDSNMFGQGVSDEETYLSRLATLLSASFPLRDWHVLNTAVPGYNTVMEVETLREKGLGYDPDLVIVEVVGNDLDLPNFIRQPQAAWALDRSLLVQFVAERVRRLAERRRAVEDHAADLMPAPEARDGNVAHFEGDPSLVPTEYADMVRWEAFEAAMRDLGGLRDQRGFTVAVLSASPSFDWFQRRSRRLAAALGFHYLNVDKAIHRYVREHRFDDYLDSPLAVSQSDPHPSAFGHDLIAREVLRLLVEQGLVKSDTPKSAQPSRQPASTREEPSG